VAGIFPWSVPALESPFGPLPIRFHFTVPTGYSTLVGTNNAGKSALLQYVFRAAMADANIGREGVCYVLPGRSLVAQTTQLGGRSLDSFNMDAQQALSTGPLANTENSRSPNGAELFSALVNHSDFMAQMRRLNEFLQRLGLPTLTLQRSQELRFDGVGVGGQGSGLRGVLPILAALTDADLKLLLIDEPEVSLEPALQRSLRTLLAEEASDERPILVATHSHLFLDRGRPGSNLVVSRFPTYPPRWSPIQSVAQLCDVTFGLLGNSTEDLFFPGNFLVAEGASDQRIVERVLELLKIRPGRVKVLSAGGVDGSAATVEAIRRTLIPVTTGDSPYARTVVALVDVLEDSGRLDPLRRLLDDRLYVLDKPSLEDYLPDALYERAGESKPKVLAEIRRGTYLDKAAVKKRVSDAIARDLRTEDFPAIPIIVEAARRALNPKAGGS
jgi:ABC-type cobalamin transport system ATPase subunit